MNTLTPLQRLIEYLARELVPTRRTLNKLANKNIPGVKINGTIYFSLCDHFTIFVRAPTAKGMHGLADEFYAAKCRGKIGGRVQRGYLTQTGLFIDMGSANTPNDIRQTRWLKKLCEAGQDQVLPILIL